MQKYFCDRCKEETKSYELMDFIFHRQSIITLEHTKYEICENCTKEFKKWLKGDKLS